MPCLTCQAVRDEWNSSNSRKDWGVCSLCSAVSRKLLERCNQFLFQLNLEWNFEMSQKRKIKKISINWFGGIIIGRAKWRISYVTHGYNEQSRRRRRRRFFMLACAVHATATTSHVFACYGNMWEDDDSRNSFFCFFFGFCGGYVCCIRSYSALTPFWKRQKPAQEFQILSIPTRSFETRIKTPRWRRGYWICSKRDERDAAAHHTAPVDQHFLCSNPPISNNSFLNRTNKNTFFRRQRRTDTVPEMIRSHLMTM